MNNGLGFQLANVPTITGLASVNANDVTTDTIEVSTLTIDGVDIETSLNDKVSKTLNNTVTGINTFSNPANVFYGDGSNLTNVAPPANMVTTDTVQTITAEKTFDTDIYVATNMRLGHGWNNVISNICFSTGSLEFAVSGENIAMGFGALNIHNGPNGNNVAIGSYTLSQGNNPYNNVAIGRSALFKAEANDNIAIGADVLANLTTGNGNFAAGGLAMAGCITGSANVAIGFVALINCNTVYCVGVGSVAGAGNKKPYNTYIGAFSGAEAEQADGIVAVGGYALNQNNVSKLAGEGHYCTGVGYYAGGTNQKVGTNNTFLGAYSDINTLGNWSNSTAVGYQATITASNQVRLGRATETVSCPGNLDVTGTITNSNLTFLSGTQTITGAKTMNNPANVLYGDGSNLTGIVAAPPANMVTTDTAQTITGQKTFSTANITVNGTNFNVGTGAGSISNTCLGYGTPKSIVFTTGSNTFVGGQAGQNMGIAADGDTYVGTSSGVGQTTGQQNTFLGAFSGNQTSGTGWRNTAVGYQCLDSMITIAEDNTAVGQQAGNAVTTGFKNTCIGSGAGGSITTGSSNICIGALATTTTATSQNQIILGTTAETMLIRGGFNWRVGTRITASISFVGIVMAQYYEVAMSAASQTITLPNPTTVGYLGTRVVFKRKVNTTAFNLAAAGTTPFLGTTSITPVASPTSIPTTMFQVDLICDGVNWSYLSTV